MFFDFDEEVSYDQKVQNPLKVVRASQHDVIQVKLKIDLNLYLYFLTHLGICWVVSSLRSHDAEIEHLLSNKESLNKLEILYSNDDV